MASLYGDPSVASPMGLTNPQQLQEMLMQRARSPNHGIPQARDSGGGGGGGGAPQGGGGGGGAGGGLGQIQQLMKPLMGMMGAGGKAGGMAGMLGGLAGSNPAQMMDGIRSMVPQGQNAPTLPPQLKGTPFEKLFDALFGTNNASPMAVDPMMSPQMQSESWDTGLSSGDGVSNFGMDTGADFGAMDFAGFDAAPTDMAFDLGGWV